MYNNLGLWLSAAGIIISLINTLLSARLIAKSNLKLPWIFFTLSIIAAVLYFFGVKITANPHICAVLPTPLFIANSLFLVGMVTMLVGIIFIYKKSAEIV